MLTSLRDCSLLIYIEMFSEEEQVQCGTYHYDTLGITMHCAMETCQIMAYRGMKAFFGLGIFF